MDGGIDGRPEIGEEGAVDIGKWEVSDKRMTVEQGLFD